MVGILVVGILVGVLCVARGRAEPRTALQEQNRKRDKIQIINNITNKMTKIKKGG